MADRVLRMRPGRGTGWMLQLVPFQYSASAALPTAVQASAAVHDTADSWLSNAPVGLGVAWMVQLVPSQCSASVCGGPGLGSEKSNQLPTAVQASAAVHDTPDNWLRVAGLGVASMLQLVPSHRSASVIWTWLPGPVKYAPTAVQA